MDKECILEKTAANCLMSVIQNAWRFTKCFVIVLMRPKKKKGKDTKQPQETELQQMPVTGPSQRLQKPQTFSTDCLWSCMIITPKQTRVTVVSKFNFFKNSVCFLFKKVSLLLILKINK